MSRNNFEDSVTILMATYQGGKFLNEQLESISSQSHTNWNLVVSDDGSTDATWDLLKQHQSKCSKDKVELRKGPGRGFCRNFLSIVCDPGLTTNYYAFSDQDDIWNTDKLSRAISFLDKVEKGKPALYCSRSQAIDETGNLLWLSPHFKRPPSFRNAIVQNIGGGNTMVFNEAARELLKATGPNLDVPSHDWWLYILVTGCGGHVYYDPVPSIMYRQHTSNVVGSNTTFTARLNRFTRLLRGQLAEWNNVHITSLNKINLFLTSDTRKVIETLVRSRNESIINRLFLFLESGIRRQTILGQIALLLAVILRKI